MNRFNILRGVAPVSIQTVEPAPVMEKVEEITKPDQSGDFSETPRLTIMQPPNFHCPRCGSNSQNSLNIHFDDANSAMNGDYCMACIARWVNENVPRLIRL